MQPFVSHTGRAAALQRANVDTDQIIPKQFLKRIERTGFGAFLFHDWRFRSDGTLNPEFELNRPDSQGATVLLTGANFGCGSSREHAPWALGGFGFRAIIAPSFADIFYANCMQNGLLPVVLPEAAITELFRRCATTRGYEVTVDLEAAQQHLPPVLLDLEGSPESAGITHRSRLEVDGYFVPPRCGAAAEQLGDRRFRQYHGQQTVLHAVGVEDVGE